VIGVQAADFRSALAVIKVFRYAKWLAELVPDQEGRAGSVNVAVVKKPSG
jgi:hypothetical protein